MGHWNLDPLQIAALTIVGGGYTRRARTLAARRRPVAAARQAWFYAGLGLLLIALVSPIDRLGETRVFYLHMVQHVLLGDLAPLAIVLGLDGRLLRPLLTLSAVGRLRGIATPLPMLGLWAANLWLWHVPFFYQAALAHSGIHALEHMLFFSSGALMWAAVIEPLPGPAWFGAGWKAVYVLGVRAAAGLLALMLIFAGHSFYPRYAVGERLWGITPADDQNLGGAILFVEGAVVTLVVFSWLFLRWMREAELGQRLLDAGHDPVVSARAARYGRSALARSARDPRPENAGGIEPDA